MSLKRGGEGTIQWTLSVHPDERQTTKLISYHTHSTAVPIAWTFRLNIQRQQFLLTATLIMLLGELLKFFDVFFLVSGRKKKYIQLNLLLNMVFAIQDTKTQIMTGVLIHYIITKFIP